MSHIMLDIETLGKRNCVIVSIGAVKFDVNHGYLEDEFYKEINLQSCIDLGLSINGNTLDWWFKQSPEAISRTFGGKQRISIFSALMDFSEFVTKDDFLWARSPRFDCGVLEDAYVMAGLPIPWDFRKECDVRTIEWLNPKIKQEYKPVGIAHDALDDCRNQIIYTIDTLKSIKIEEIK